MKHHLSRHEFAAIDPFIQAALVNYEGVDLGVRYYREGYSVLLYSLYDFYVEIWQTRRTKELKKIVSFSSYKRLDIFLSSIDISFINDLGRA